jgi:hypothetical protein
MQFSRLFCAIMTGLFLLAANPGLAEQGAPKLDIAAPFTNHMILQRQSNVPVWGWGKPGETVKVSFAEQVKSTVIGADGKWMMKLDALEASAVERDFMVSASGGESISLTGVLVGEVWFASGQSNMVWTASQSMCKDLANQLAMSKDEVPIREINIQTVSALYPQERANSEGGWKKSGEAGGFSALSLSFAYELHKELGVPIGILLSAHSNTRIEAFTQGRAILAHPKLRDDAKQIIDADPLTEQGHSAYAQYDADIVAWQKEAAAAAIAEAWVPKRPDLPGIAGQWRGPSQFYNGKIHPVIPYAIRGVLWCQGESNDGDGDIYAARMEALVNGYRDAWSMSKLPFYFTQMQSYGKGSNPDDLGMAELRQAQHRFFVENRENVGMVVQFDVNNDNAGGIHYYNKLHPGMRMARWALAKQYGKDIAYTGPIVSGYKADGDKVVISFEKESLFGGLMVGSKGSSISRNPGAYFEPAKPSPGEKLNYFRLCGADKKWHAAEAKIIGETVVVTSPNVPKPVGVQYAYSAVPEGANLYNMAGLPATPFSQIDGQFILTNYEQKKAQDKVKYAKFIDPNHPQLQVAEYYRDGVIIQRGKPIPVWGHANTGETVTVTLGGVTHTAVPNKYQQWSVYFPPLEASTQPITLSVKTTNGFSKTVKDILVGDVWFITGSPQLVTEWPYDERQKDAARPEPLPMVREFRRRTNGDWFETPRKRQFENGDGKYRSHWVTADYGQMSQGVTMFAYHFAKALDRQGVPQGFMTMASGRADKNKGHFYASPLSWTAFHGVKDLKDPALQDRINELLLKYPDSAVASKATAAHLAEVRSFVTKVTSSQHGASPSSLPLVAPAFPEPGKNAGIPIHQVPTYSYNWCVSPHTPMAVAGVIWVPSEVNLSANPADYAAELQAYAMSLPKTYGQPSVQLLYAQPSPALVPGITAPNLSGAEHVTFDQWPESLEEIAKQLARKAK